MTLKIIPVIGSRGFYELAEPFDKEVVHHIEYTCQAVRRLSELIANNEKPWETIYKAREIEETIYDEDLSEDAYIVSLQSNQGQWLYVPHRYILTYPSTDGIAYRSVMMTISLPPLPISQDLTALIMDLKDMTEALLGVSVIVKPVETSKRVLISNELHEAKMVERRARQEDSSTLYAQNIALQEQNTALNERLKRLEAYIAQHHT